MAIVVLLLWMFTAGAGFFLLVTSSLGRARSASAPASARPAPARPAPARPAPSFRPQRVAAPAAAAPSGPLSPREAKRAARERWDPPSLVAARQAPILPGGQALVEFAHPAVGIVGLGFWLGFTLVHNHALGWIAFGLAAVTACVGLGWFTANTRAVRRAPGAGPSFAGRLVALHGSAATLTVALAALAALVLH
jgi:hypothetical protein